MHSQTWTPLPPPSPQHLSGSSPCTSPKHAVSWVRHRLAIQFLHDSIHVRMPFSQIIPPSPSPSESKSLCLPFRFIQVFDPWVGWEDPLEKRKASHSSNLAWRIPWTVWSLGSQRVRHDWATFTFTLGFPDSSAGKESTCKAGDPGSIPGSRRSAGEGIGHPLQYSWASLVTQLVKNPPAMQETWVWSLGWEDPLEKGKASHSSILVWRIPWTIPWTIPCSHEEFFTSLQFRS